MSFILSIYQSLAEKFGFTYDLQLAFAKAIFNLASSIATLFWLFAVRNRLHYMCMLHKRSMFWMNGFFTFIANAIYLQYKINQVIDHKTYVSKQKIDAELKSSSFSEGEVLRGT